MDAAQQGVYKIPNEPEQVKRRQHAIVYSRPHVFLTPQGHPLRLANILGRRDLEGILHNHRESVLESCGTKYSIVIHIKNQKRFTKQKYAHSGRRGSTLGSVARQIAETVEEYIDDISREKPSGRDDYRLGPGYIEYGDLYLLEMYQIVGRKASFQVVLGRIPSSVSNLAMDMHRNMCIAPP